MSHTLTRVHSVCVESTIFDFKYYYTHRLCGAKSVPTLDEITDAKKCSMATSEIFVSIWQRFGTSVEITVSLNQISANIGNLVLIWHQFGIENYILIANRCQHLKFGV